MRLGADTPLQGNQDSDAGDHSPPPPLQGARGGATNFTNLALNQGQDGMPKPLCAYVFYLLDGLDQFSVESRGLRILSIHG
jgi:hypothetical protein